ncbi:hypothetical protein EMCRGX_G001630 [Ephydatia muelleri]
MADDRSTSISNQEAFERYVMKVKSNVEAARRFMNDEGIVDEPSSDEHEGNEVEEIEKEQDEASTSTIAPLDALSPRHSKRRTDTLFALLKKEAEVQKITTTQLLGYMLHRENYIHDRAVASVGLKLFHKGKWITNWRGLGRITACEGVKLTCSLKDNPTANLQAPPPPPTCGIQLLASNSKGLVVVSGVVQVSPDWVSTCSTEFKLCKYRHSPSDINCLSIYLFRQ